MGDGRDYPLLLLVRNSTRVPSGDDECVGVSSLLLVVLGPLSMKKKEGASQLRHHYLTLFSSRLSFKTSTKAYGLRASWVCFVVGLGALA